MRSVDASIKKHSRKVPTEMSKLKKEGREGDGDRKKVTEYDTLGVYNIGPHLPPLQIQPSVMRDVEDLCDLGERQTYKPFHYHQLKD